MGTEKGRPTVTGSEAVAWAQVSIAESLRPTPGAIAHPVGSGEASAWRLQAQCFCCEKIAGDRACGLENRRAWMGRDMR